MDKKINDRLKKIIELASRGVSGEKKNAKRIAEKELEKLGLTLDEFLHDEAKAKYRFPYSNKYEDRLFDQIMANMGVGPIYSLSKAGKKLQENMVELTKSEYAEASVKYNILKIDLKKEHEVFFHAFIAANNLYGREPMDPEKASKEDLEKDRRAQAMSREINRSKVRKQLTK